MPEVGVGPRQGVGMHQSWGTPCPIGQFVRVCGTASGTMPGMGFLEANGLAYRLDDGRELFRAAFFRVSSGQIVALVGANGVGKTTLLRVLSGGLAPTEGGLSVQGGLGVMPQFVGSVRDDTTVRDLLLAVAAP